MTSYTIQSNLNRIKTHFTPNAVGKPESFRVNPTAFSISRTYQKRTLKQMALGLYGIPGLRREGSARGCWGMQRLGIKALALLVYYKGIVEVIL